MRKVAMNFSKASRDNLNSWLLGEEDIPVNKKQIQMAIGASYPTVIGYFKKLENGESIESILTFTQLEALIKYQNQLVDEAKEDKQKDIELNKQLKQINAIRRHNKQEPLSLDQFKKQI